MDYSNASYILMAVCAVGIVAAQMFGESSSSPKRKVTVLPRGGTNKRRNAKNKSRRK